MIIAERTTAPQAVQFVRAVPMEARNARDPNFNKTRPARSVRTPHTVHSGVEICTLSSVVKLNVARRKSKRDVDEPTKRAGGEMAEYTSLLAASAG